MREQRQHFSMGTVLLVRHCETVWNREGRVQGWASTSLSDRGRKQARSLATALSESPTATRLDGESRSEPEPTATSVQGAGDDTAGVDAERPTWSEGAVDRLVTSDLQRARETAAAVERATGCQPASDAGWRERGMGRLQGLQTRELFERHPQLSLKHSGKAAAQRAPEGGETLSETRERVLEAWDRLRADLRADETVIVVSHSGPISLLLGHLRDIPITEAVLNHSQDNGAINQIRVDNSTDDGAGSAGQTDDEASGVQLVRENWTAYRDWGSES
jgi:probable phosphoglycerate mutase